ncbi:hypothetical protein NBRC116493_01000 [Aurantivibrio infirmus]
MSDKNFISVSLLDKDYQLACPPEEQEALYRAARGLDSRLRAIRTGGNIVGLERILIMAALNLSYELHLSKENSSSGTLDESALLSLTDKIDSALNKLNA